MLGLFFFFDDPSTPESYPYAHTLSLHDALPFSVEPGRWSRRCRFEPQTIGGDTVPARHAECRARSAVPRAARREHELVSGGGRFKIDPIRLDRIEIGRAHV